MSLSSRDPLCPQSGQRIHAKRRPLARTQPKKTVHARPILGPHVRSGLELSDSSVYPSVSFFRLPFELREVVYFYVLQSTHQVNWLLPYATTKRVFHPARTSWYGYTSQPQINAQSSLMRTCHHIRDEGTTVLAREITPFLLRRIRMCADLSTSLNLFSNSLRQTLRSLAFNMTIVTAASPNGQELNNSHVMAHFFTQLRKEIPSLRNLMCTIDVMVNSIVGNSLELTAGMMIRGLESLRGR